MTDIDIEKLRADIAQLKPLFPTLTQPLVDLGLLDALRAKELIKVEAWTIKDLQLRLVQFDKMTSPDARACYAREMERDRNMMPRDAFAALDFLLPEPDDPPPTKTTPVSDSYAYLRAAHPHIPTYQEREEAEQQQELMDQEKVRMLALLRAAMLSLTPEDRAALIADRIRMVGEMVSEAEERKAQRPPRERATPQRQAMDRGR